MTTTTARTAARTPYWRHYRSAFRQAASTARADPVVIGSQTSHHGVRVNEIGILTGDALLRGHHHLKRTWHDKANRQHFVYAWHQLAQRNAMGFRTCWRRASLLKLRDVLNGDDRLDSADMLCIPGGFSYGDHLGAGSLAGQFVQASWPTSSKCSQKPIIAICNGFQIAMRAGLFGTGVALTVNAGGTFRNLMRQPHLVEPEANNIWLDGLEGQTLRFPCAHGEGRLVYDDSGDWPAALRYPSDNNPDGSTNDIGGISSENGLVFGLMDHPERYLDGPGNLDIFANGVRAAA